MSQNLTNERDAPSLFRCLAAMFYDALAILAIWFFATLVIVIVRRGVAIDAGNPFFTLYLALTAYAYFGYCWARSGQTLGMKSWRFRLVAADATTPITWRQTALRFATALISAAAFGLGYWWVFFDAERRTWHDHASGTCLRDTSED